MKDPIRREKALFAFRVFLILATAFVIGTSWGWSDPEPEPGRDHVCHEKQGGCSAWIDIEGRPREAKFRFGDVVSDRYYYLPPDEGWCKIKPKCKHK